VDEDYSRFIHRGYQEIKFNSLATMAWSVSMKRLIASLKSIRLRQLLTVFLIGLVLVVNTACNRATKEPGTTAYEGTSLKGLPGKVEPQITKDSRIKTKPETGMNSYPDVDPRVNTTEAEKKAQGLIENAERNVIDETADVGETSRRILGKKNENLDQFNQNVKRNTQTAGDTAQQATDEAKNTLGRFGDNVKSAAEKVTGNTENAAKEAQRNVDATANRASTKASDTARDVRQASRDTADRAQSKANEVAGDTQEASGNILDRVTKSVKRATEDATDFVQTKTDDTAKGTQRAAEDAANAVRGRT